jgi:hypothetical protein
MQSPKGYGSRVPELQDRSLIQHFTFAITIMLEIAASNVPPNLEKRFWDTPRATEISLAIQKCVCTLAVIAACGKVGR